MRRSRRTASALFTAESAARTLPLLTRIVGDAVPLARDLAERRARLAWVRKTPGGKHQEGGPFGEELADIAAGIDADADRLAGFAAEVRQIGAVLRDAETGLVEFPGPRASEHGRRPGRVLQLAAGRGGRHPLAPRRRRPRRPRPRPPAGRAGRRRVPRRPDGAGRPLSRPG